MDFASEVKVLKPSVLLATLKGVLDAGTAIQFEMAVSGHLKDPTILNVILDVPGLTFVSSSGLRVLMIIIKALGPKNGKLFMVGATPQVIGVIKMSGMTRWIHLRDSIQECEL